MDRPSPREFSNVQKGPALPGLSAPAGTSGGYYSAAAVHHLGFEFSLKGLDLTEDGETARRAAHLALKLVEDFVQPLGGGPEGRVVLSG
jgi:hypothetical protein